MNCPSPRVLIITKTLLNEQDGASLSLRNWLRSSFPHNIAQIYSGAVGECLPGILAYKLGADDRRFGRLFVWFKRIAQPDVGRYKSLSQNNNSQLVAKIRRAIAVAANAATNIGLWERLFEVRVSSEMRKFIRGFRPDVIFAQGFDLTFCLLPVLVQKEFGAPIITSIVDDWEPHLYSSPSGKLWMRRVVRGAFLDLLRHSDVRYCISSEMATEYRNRYRLHFDVLMQVDHRAVLNCGSAREIFEGRLIVAYSGSLALGRWQGLIELSRAILELRSEGIVGAIRVYTSSLPNEASHLGGIPNIEILPPPADEDVLAHLAEANVVFLPESFNPNIAQYVKYSISTKAHLYMMTGAVPLVYGPAGTGTVEYARREGWGVVVVRQSVSDLKSALRLIVRDKGLADKIVCRALNVFESNHGPRLHGNIASRYKRVSA